MHGACFFNFARGLNIFTNRERNSFWPSTRAISAGAIQNAPIGLSSLRNAAIALETSGSTWPLNLREQKYRAFGGTVTTREY